MAWMARTPPPPPQKVQPNPSTLGREKGGPGKSLAHKPDRLAPATAGARPPLPCVHCRCLFGLFYPSSWCCSLPQAFLSACVEVVGAGDRARTPRPQGSNLIGGRGQVGRGVGLCKELLEEADYFALGSVRERILQAFPLLGTSVRLDTAILYACRWAQHPHWKCPQRGTRCVSQVTCHPGHV